MGVKKVKKVEKVEKVEKVKKVEKVLAPQATKVGARQLPRCF